MLLDCLSCKGSAWNLAGAAASITAKGAGRNRAWAGGTGARVTPAMLQECRGLGISSPPV